MKFDISSLFSSKVGSKYTDSGFIFFKFKTFQILQNYSNYIY